MQLEYKEIISSRRFGVELEVAQTFNKQQLKFILSDFEFQNKTNRPIKVASGAEGWAQTSSNEFWHVKYDSTCGFSDEGGWEIASFIGSGPADIHHIANAAEFLRREGVETNRNCGLHIHVEVADFSVEDMARLLARWLKIELMVMSICSKHRRFNRFCMPLSLFMPYDRRIKAYDPGDPAWLWQQIRPKNLKIHENQCKRVALNTIGFARGLKNKSYHRKTVELRLPECELVVSHIMGWLTLFLNFVDSCKHGEYPDSLAHSSTVVEIMQHLGLAGKDPLYILGPQLIATKEWLLRKVHDRCLGTLTEEARTLLEMIEID